MHRTTLRLVQGTPRFDSPRDRVWRDNLLRIRDWVGLLPTQAWRNLSAWLAAPWAPLDRRIDEMRDAGVPQEVVSVWMHVALDESIELSYRTQRHGPTPAAPARRVA